MPLRGSVNCLNLFFIVLLTCLKHIHSTKPIGKQQEYFHAVRKSVNDGTDFESKFKPADWSINILRQAEEEELLSLDEELGFDLTDDEIRKLKLWHKGIIPYYIDAVSFEDPALRDRIRSFLNQVNAITKINFMELPSVPIDFEKTRWVFFINRRFQLGCADHSVLNITNEGVQHVVLGYDCLATGRELAEAVLAIAGVPAQHNSPDRDHYLKIFYENITPEKKYLFQKLNDNEWLFHDLKYDAFSAGHFDFHKHSINGRATIGFTDMTSPYSVSLEGGIGFSNQDILKLRMLYNYIVKKKVNRAPECGKLFRKGHNYNKVPSIAWELKSRPKPNRYLGLPDADTDKTPDVATDKTDAENKDVGEEGQDGDDDWQPDEEVQIEQEPHIFRAQHKI